MAADDVSLRDHFEQRLHDLDRRFDVIEAHRVELRDLLKASVDETRQLLLEYKEQANEWRGTVNDIIAHRPTREEMDAAVGKLELKMSLTQVSVGELKTAQSIQTGAKAQGVDIRATAIAVVATAAVVASLALAAVVAFM